MATPDILSAAGGILLSLVFSYAPGVRPWFAALEPQQKALVNLGSVVAVAVGAFALGCFGIIEGVVQCKVAGARELASAVLSVAIANMTTYGLTKRIAPYEPPPPFDPGLG